MNAETLASAVRAKVEALQSQLLAKVEANLSGWVLQSRSGALKASIMASIDVSADAVTARIASIGVPYAAIQEYGGRTSPHDIVPVKAQALAFVGAAGPMFARRVHHPGSLLPARPYLGSALDALHPDIAGGLKDSILGALGAT